MTNCSNCTRITNVAGKYYNPSIKSYYTNRHGSHGGLFWQDYKLMCPPISWADKRHVTNIVAQMVRTDSGLAWWVVQEAIKRNK